MSKKVVTTITHAQEVASHQSDMNVFKIVTQLNVSRNCVMNATKRYEDHGTFDHLKRSERPKKLSDCDEHYLKKLMKVENRLTVTRIMLDLNNI